MAPPPASPAAATHVEHEPMPTITPPTSELPERAALFAAGGPTEAAASALVALSPAELDALVRALERDRRRDHLELLGATAALPTPTRKAARKAAYRLKSRGVAATVEPGHRGGVDLRATVDLDDRVLAHFPGLGGRYVVVLGDLPDASGVSIQADGDGVRVAATSMGRAQMRAHAREHGAALGLVIAPAALGVQLAARLAVEIRRLGGEFPPGWSDVVWWCERAQALGADPAGSDAALALAGGPLDAGDAAAARAVLGRLGRAALPAGVVLDEIDQRAQDALLLEADYDETEAIVLLAGIAEGVCDELYQAPDVRAAAVRSLDATSDVLLSAGDEEGARVVLATARALEGGALLPHELPLLAEAFQRILDPAAFWRQRQAIVADREASASAE